MGLVWERLGMRSLTPSVSSQGPRDRKGRFEDGGTIADAAAARWKALRGETGMARNSPALKLSHQHEINGQTMQWLEAIAWEACVRGACWAAVRK